MAIATTMNSEDGDRDGHENDVVMPGFRFHPTEEELIEFYLRRKVEGKQFNVELIVFLDLYRYDPWELPALAAIGEKEWFFYVPRDRKYRNGDRPNRVTTSGYWKATGADRMIRTETSRPIGLKKTLVFYSGKAPKGIRTSWIMNEYRLPQNETSQSQKAEISLCRVYKRAGVEDHFQHSKPSSSKPSPSNKKQATSHNLTCQLALTGEPSSSQIAKLPESSAYIPIRSTPTDQGNCVGQLHLYQRNFADMNTISTLLAPPSTSSLPAATVDELNRLMAIHQGYLPQPNQFPPISVDAPPPPILPLGTSTLPNTLVNFADKLWEWNPNIDGGRDYNGDFK